VNGYRLLTLDQSPSPTSTRGWGHWGSRISRSSRSWTLAPRRSRGS